MLNKKFYTGLPPEMIERNNPTKINRLQSNIFWPDDINSDSPDEYRVKRRTSQSFQLPTEKLEIKRQISAESDVDAKQMFSNEFTKSSIQFYDNLDFNTNENKKYKHKNLMKCGRQLKQDIALKPTALVMELPKDAVDEEYATSKKKEAFSSKIKFYDYLNDDRNEVECNLKNSPKLQIKRNVNHIHDNKFIKICEQSNVNKNTNNDIKRVANDQQISRNSLNRSNVNAVKDFYVTLTNGNNEINSLEKSQHKTQKERSPRTKNIEYDILRNRNEDERDIEAGIQKLYMGSSNNRNNEYNKDIQKTDYNKRDKMTSQKPIKARQAFAAHTLKLNQTNLKTENELHQWLDQESDNISEQKINQYSKKVNENNFQLNNDRNSMQRKIPTFHQFATSNGNTHISTFETSADNREETDSQKHLRSSICFGNNQTSRSQQRRNARSLAATQRITVGLPD